MGQSFDRLRMRGASFDRLRMRGASFDGLRMRGASFDRLRMRIFTRELVEGRTGPWIDVVAPRRTFRSVGNCPARS
jgi:hypothetical protein